MNPVKKLKRILTDLINQKSTPEEIALGAAVGVFIGFSPWYGIQIFIAMACAYLIPRVNKVAVIAGAQINWVAPLYYYFEYKLGLAILQEPGSHITIERLKHINVKLILSILWPLFIGSLIFGAAGSVLAYVIARHLVVRARARAK